MLLLTSKTKSVFQFLICLVLCQGAGAIGTVFTVPAISEWYQFLDKPSFNPPNWIFGPVWTILYSLMAVSFFLIWRQGLEDKKRKTACLFFLIHLIFNALWSVLFFGLRNPLLGLIDILILEGMILGVMLQFYAIQKTAGILLIPYFLWVSFATVLNFFIWKLN